MSVLDGWSRWIVKAVCLSYTEARLISEELNAVGIKARFRTHSFGIEERKTRK